MLEKPETSQLVLALEAIREGEISEGLLRCTRHDAEAIKRIVLNRSKELGGYIRQLVRFVRLAALCRERGPVDFLYRAVRSFRVENFRRVVINSSIPSTAIRIEGARILFLEPKMLSEFGGAKAFDLGFSQLPRLATLLDFLHNTFGYDTLYFKEAQGETDSAGQLDGIFRSLVGTAPEESADEVARRLQSLLNRWLSQALGQSSHGKRQEDAIADFLRIHDALAPEAINDDLIFAFWRSEAAQARAGESEGFRQYVSAVRAMLRYLQALRQADAESSHSEDSDEALLVKNKSPVEFDSEGFATPQLQLHQWQSPLTVLAPLCERVKWLDKKDRLRLRNYLGAFERSAGNREESQEWNDEDSYGSLMGPHRFDLRFVRTLLRVDVFGSAQSNITAALRRQLSGRQALGTELSSINDGSYEAAKGKYSEIRERTSRAMLASIHVLGAQGDPNALVLIERLYGREVVEYFSGRMSDPENRKNAGDISRAQNSVIAANLRSTFGRIAAVPEPIDELVRLTKTAAEKIRRSGFQPQERDDPKVQECFREGAHALTSLLDEISRLLDQLDRSSLLEWAKADQMAFEKVFRQLYEGELDEPSANLDAPPI